MIDLIFVVDNPITWHQQNMEQNWTHYSFLKRFGAKTISRIQENFACGVYYNPFVRIDDKVRLFKHILWLHYGYGSELIAQTHSRRTSYSLPELVNSMCNNV